MPSKKFILWCDIETTGNRSEAKGDKLTDHILEIGLLLTDQNLNLIASNAWLITPGTRTMPIGMIDPVVIEMHATSGLWRDLAKKMNNYEIIEDDILAWLDQNTDNENQHIPFAGSGIGHFDRQYIDHWLPNFSKRLTYWPLDIGVVRRFSALAFPEAAPAILTNRFLDAKTHRALDDAIAALAEARQWVATQRRGFGAIPAQLWSTDAAKTHDQGTDTPSPRPAPEPGQPT